MTHNEIHEALFDNTIRFEQVIYMAGALGQADSPSQDLRDLLEEEDDETILQAFPGFPVDVLDDPDVGIEFSAEWLIDNDRLGFLAKVATPVMTYHKESECSSFSWGYYRTQWVYGETMDEVVAKAIAWADKQREAEKARAK